MERIKAEGESQNWCKHAVDILLAGGIVAFPTETVYGLGACPSVPGALKKLDAAKGQRGSKPYTVHIAYPEQLTEYVKDPPWLARVLARKGWPGPITLVIELQEAQRRWARERFGETYDKLFSDKSIGLRCSDHPVARALLSSCPVPVVAPSANPSGRPGPHDADEVCKYFSENEIDLVLDAGATYFRNSSTVVGVNGRELKVLRSGPLNTDAIERLARFNILFVCTGNTCRSPMAEVICRKVLAEMLACKEGELEDYGISIGSAGTSGVSSMPPSCEAVEAMKNFSIDLSKHRSRPVTIDLVNSSDIVYVMTSRHKDFVCELAPGAVKRVQSMDTASDIADPLGQPVNVYVACAERFQHLIRNRLRELFQ